MKKIITRNTARWTGMTAAALLVTGAITPMAHAAPGKALPPGVTTHCEGRLVHVLGDDEVSLKVRRVSDDKFCAYVTKGYFHVPYKSIGYVGQAYITTGGYTTRAKSSWGKYVVVPVGKCVTTWIGTHYPSGAGSGHKGTYCNVS